MFLVNWLSGKQQRKPEVVAPASAPTVKKDSKTAKIEQTLKALGGRIRNFQEKQKRLLSVVNLNRVKAKDFVSGGDQARARQYAIIVVKYQQRLGSYSLRKKALAELMCQLEQALKDMETIASLERCSFNCFSKQQQANSQDAPLMSYPSKIVESEDVNVEDTVENSPYEEEVNILLIQLADEIKREKKQQDDSLRQLANL